MFPIRDHNPSQKFPLINILIIIVTSLVFFMEISAPDQELFIERFALIPNLVDIGNPSSFLPFIYSVFLHGGWLHIISNMWFLFIFGDNIEAVMGHIPYLVFYLLAGIVAGLSQFLFSLGSDIPTLGASGAVSGVLGAYMVLYPKNKIDTLVFSFFGFLHQVQLPASIMLGYWFLIQIFSGIGSLGIMEGGGVAWWAHIGGFAFGYLVINLFSGKKKKPENDVVVLEREGNGFFS